MFKQDFVTITSFASYAVGSVLAIAKVTVLRRNRSKFVKIISKLEQEPFLPNQKRGGDTEAKLFKECIRITVVQTYIYWIAACGTAIGAISSSFATRLQSSDYHDWKNAYGPLTVLNVTYSPNYEISWVYQNISILYVSSFFIASDLLIAAVLTHLCYQFKILQNFIRRLIIVAKRDSAANDDMDGSLISWEYLKQTLKEAVDYHLAILKIAEEMEEVFSQLLLFVFLGTLSLVCLAIFQASMVSFDDPECVRHVGEGLSSVMQVLLVCYWSEQVAYESQLVGTAVYESDFVGTDLKFQRSLILIIRRSQNPVYLTAGKFTDISLETFTWIMRASYSAFLVLCEKNAQKV